MNLWVIAKDGTKHRVRETETDVVEVEHPTQTEWAEFRPGGTWCRFDSLAAVSHFGVGDEVTVKSADRTWATATVRERREGRIYLCPICLIL